MVSVEEKWKSLVDDHGRWIMSAVAARDERAGRLCETGICMEVLSWKMVVEEPEACGIISQALNRGQALALKTTEVTALAALANACTKESEADLANRVVFETVQRKLRHLCAVYVDESEFIDLFEFVVELGALRAPFAPRLLEFAARFVDSKQRQLRLTAFAQANKLPAQCPWTKIALVMRAYRKPPHRTWCPSPEPVWAKCETHWLEKVEDLLRYFHKHMEPAVAGMASHDRLKLLSNVSCVVADTL